jgi:hypothetical protein
MTAPTRNRRPRLDASRTGTRSTGSRRRPAFYRRESNFSYRGVASSVSTSRVPPQPVPVKMEVNDAAAFVTIDSVELVLTSLYVLLLFIIIKGFALQYELVISSSIGYCALIFQEGQEFDHQCCLNFNCCLGSTFKAAQRSLYVRQKCIGCFFAKEIAPRVHVKFIWTNFAPS